MAVSKAKIRQIVKDIPPEEWWKRDSQKTFEEVAQELADSGFEADEIKELLSRLYNAVAEEFGN